ncbi:uncharacterized protein BO80DRAFT_422482 [Aspergillus ibericus CBS 121593]|uniref:Uncharacterized protein n=1 Tax=Aspergillus ibericus CBS 121593 TaxID=1448316 RepID=A0A395H8U5_9EURO|nr:hypothetical protein BO80DRAFT_422482 [Aspergillus ibericus CBS 121593]RAL04100.1 hypothetical protein BO80DRAFT_422482 [Aspergillus ibericus CBS 121593]
MAEYPLGCKLQRTLHLVIACGSCISLTTVDSASPLGISDPELWRPARSRRDNHWH